jgi:hypothetical protein
MLRPFIIRVYKVDPSFKKFSNWMTRVLLEWTDHRQRYAMHPRIFPYHIDLQFPFTLCTAMSFLAIAIISNIFYIRLTGYWS